MAKQPFRRHLRSEKIIFLKALMKSPLRTGAVIPSSVALGGFMCRHISLREPGFVVEIGAGTGRLTKSLLNLGIDRERLFVVEYEKDLCHFLRQTLPGINVIHGNALNLGDILPPEVVGH
ncbi:MAG: rRNA adenine N-6-methyltransferase family protein, partial [Alphaproteobacteria bacterium]